MGCSDQHEQDLDLEHAFQANFSLSGQSLEPFLKFRFLAQFVQCVWTQNAILEKGEPAAREFVGSTHVRDSADSANHILNRILINESCSQKLFKHTTVVGLREKIGLTPEFISIFFIFQEESTDFQLILNCCSRMTSSTISVSRGTPASYRSLPENQGTLHDHQSKTNEQWSNLHGHQGILRADQDTMRERQVTPATQATPNRHQSPPRTYRRTSEEADLYWRAVVI